MDRVGHAWKSCLEAFQGQVQFIYKAHLKRATGRPKWCTGKNKPKKYTNNSKIIKAGHSYEVLYTTSSSKTVKTAHSYKLKATENKYVLRHDSDKVGADLM